jgi:hypothetical protein
LLVRCAVVVLHRRVACRRAPVGCLDQPGLGLNSIFVPHTGTTDVDDAAAYASAAAAAAMDNSRGVLPRHITVVVVVHFLFTADDRAMQQGLLQLHPPCGVYHVPATALQKMAKRHLEAGRKIHERTGIVGAASSSRSIGAVDLDHFSFTAHGWKISRRDRNQQPRLVLRVVVVACYKIADPPGAESRFMSQNVPRRAFLFPRSRRAQRRGRTRYAENLLRCL